MEIKTVILVQIIVQNELNDILSEQRISSGCFCRPEKCVKYLPPDGKHQTIILIWK